MPATIARKRPTLDQVRRWPATCTVAEAALALGVSRATLYEALAPRRAARPGGPGEPQDPGPDALAGRRARGPGGGVTGLTSLELCAGAGGTALGLEQAGFTHAGLAETDADCCRTLRANRPGWPVAQCDIVRVDAGWFAGIDLISAGLPCTPHSRGGAQLGAVDERHLWDTALRITSEARPRAVMLETADAILTPRFAAERAGTLERLHGLGYRTWWQVIDASGHGVPQRRRRAVLVAFREAAAFTWPAPLPGPPPPSATCCST